MPQSPLPELIPNLEGTLSYTSSLSGYQYSWFALGIGFKF